MKAAKTKPEDSLITSMFRRPPGPLPEPRTPPTYYVQNNPLSQEQNRPIFGVEQRLSTSNPLYQDGFNPVMMRHITGTYEQADLHSTILPCPYLLNSERNFDRGYYLGNSNRDPVFLKPSVYIDFITYDIECLHDKLMPGNEDIHFFRKELDSGKVKSSIFAEFELLSVFYKNIVVFVKVLAHNSVEQELNSLTSKTIPTLMSKPVSIECKSDVLGVTVGRCPANLKLFGQRPYMAIVSTRSLTAVYFISTNQSDGLVVEKTPFYYNISIGHQDLKILNSGRIFFMDSSDTMIKEMNLRDLNGNNIEQVFGKVIDAVKMSKAVSIKRANNDSWRSNLIEGFFNLPKIVDNLIQTSELKYSTIDVDQTRNILYHSLTWEIKRNSFLDDRLFFKSVIRIYDLGEFADSFEFVREIDAGEVLDRVYRDDPSRKTASGDRYDYQEGSNYIISISAVSIFESYQVMLIIFFRSGDRIFISLDLAELNDTLPNKHRGFYRYSMRPTGGWRPLGYRPSLRVCKEDFISTGPNDTRIIQCGNNFSLDLQYAKYFNGQFLFSQCSERSLTPSLFVSYSPSCGPFCRQFGVAQENISYVGRVASQAGVTTNAVILDSWASKRTARALVTDPHLEGKKRGHTIDLKQRYEFPFYQYHVKQVFIEPEILAVLSTHSLILSLRQRPVDLLFFLIYFQINFKIPEVDTPATTNFPLSTYNRTDKPVEPAIFKRFSRNLSNFFVNYGPLEGCVNLLQIICSKYDDKFYYSVSQEAQFTTLSPQQNQDMSFNQEGQNFSFMGPNHSERATSLRQNLFPEKMVGLKVITKGTRQNETELAIQLYFKLGAMAFVRQDRYRLDQGNFHNRPAYHQEFFAPAVSATQPRTLLYDSLLTYFVRLTRPIWNNTIFDVESIESKDGRLTQIVETVSLRGIDVIGQKLSDLMAFLLCYKSQILVVSRDDSTSNLASAPFNLKPSLDISQIIDKTIVIPKEVAEFFAETSKSIFTEDRSSVLEDIAISKEEQEARYEFYCLVNRTIQVLTFINIVISRKSSLKFFSQAQYMQLAQLICKDLVLHPKANDVLSKYLCMFLLFEDKREVLPLCRSFRSSMPLFFGKVEENFLTCYHQAIELQRLLFDRKNSLGQGETSDKSSLVYNFRSQPEYQELKRVFSEMQNCCKGEKIFLVEIIQPLYAKTQDYNLFFEAMADSINYLSKLLNNYSQSMYSETQPETINLNKPMLDTRAGDTPEVITFDYDATYGTVCRDKRHSILALALETLNSLWLSIKTENKSSGFLKMLKNSFIGSNERAMTFVDKAASYFGSTVEESTALKDLYDKLPLAKTLESNISRLMESFDLASFLRSTPNSERELILNQAFDRFLNRLDDTSCIFDVLKWALSNKQLHKIQEFSDHVYRTVILHYTQLPIYPLAASHLLCASSSCADPELRFFLASRLALISNLANKTTSEEDEKTGTYNDSYSETHFPINERLNCLSTALDILTEFSLETRNNHFKLDPIVEKKKIDEVKQTLLFQMYLLEVIKCRLFNKLVSINFRPTDGTLLESEKKFTLKEDSEIIMILRGLRNDYQFEGVSNFISDYEQLAYSFLHFDFIKTTFVMQHCLFEAEIIYYGKYCLDHDAKEKLLERMKYYISMLTEAEFCKRLQSKLLFTHAGAVFPANCIDFLYYSIKGLKRSPDATEKVAWPELIPFIEKKCEDKLIELKAESSPITDTLGGLFKAHKIQYDYYWLPQLLLDTDAISYKDLINNYVALSKGILTDRITDGYRRIHYLVRLVNNFIVISKIVNSVMSRENLNTTSRFTNRNTNDSSILPKESASITKLQQYGHEFLNVISNIVSELLTEIERGKSLLPRPAMIQKLRERVSNSI